MRKKSGFPILFSAILLSAALLLGGQALAAPAETAENTLLYGAEVSPYLLPGKTGDTVLLRWVMPSGKPVTVRYGAGDGEEPAALEVQPERARFSPYYRGGTWYGTAELPLSEGLVYALTEPGQEPTQWQTVAGAEDGVLNVFLTSDSHISNEKEAGRIDALIGALPERQAPELICHTGDINEDSRFGPDILIRGAESFRTVPVAAVCGNHDSLEAFYEYFDMPGLIKERPGPQYTSQLMDYCFEKEGVLFIGLNMKCGDIATHGDYVLSAVEEHPDCLWRVVMIHYSFFSNGSHARDATLQHFQEQLSEVFARADVDLVLSGHDHEYDRSLLYAGATPVQGSGGPSVRKAEGETLYVSLPTAVGTKFYGKESLLNEPPAAEAMKFEPGYVLARFSEKTLVLRAYTAEGELADSVVLSRRQ